MSDASGDHSYQSSCVNGPPIRVACAPSGSATYRSDPAAPTYWRNASRVPVGAKNAVSLSGPEAISAAGASNADRV